MVVISKTIISQIIFINIMNGDIIKISDFDIMGKREIDSQGCS
jgi:hypothetical protein